MVSVSSNIFQSLVTLHYATSSHSRAPFLVLISLFSPRSLKSLSLSHTHLAEMSYFEEALFLYKISHLLNQTFYHHNVKTHIQMCGKSTTFTTKIL